MTRSGAIPVVCATCSPGAVIASRIYVEMVDPETADETELAIAYPDHAEPGDVAVYQFATASSMAPWLAARSETLVVNYHNITPPELVASWNNPLARGQLRAQAELRLLAPRTTLAVADSAYNREDLVAAGFARSVVVPPSAALGSELLRAARRQGQPRAAAAGRPLAQRRAGGAEQGHRPDRDRARGDPGPLGSRRHPAHRRQARHRVL